MRVIFFPTCLADLLFPEAAEAAERVLRRAGCEVDFRERAVCCGQPAWNSGHLEEALRVATGTLRSLQGDDPIVMCSGSCTTMVHEYWPELFEDTRWEAAARDVASRATEFSSFVAGLPEDSIGELSVDGTQTITYHDSCHMMRSLGLRREPRDLLGRIEGIELREMDACERCCGFGGTFSIRYPELSSAMADEKVNDAKAQGVSTIVASDLGCLMQICGRAEARGEDLGGKDIAEVLDEASGPGAPRDPRS